MSSKDNIPRIAVAEREGKANQKKKSRLGLENKNNSKQSMKSKVSGKGIQGQDANTPE